jgi:hypothetical protein
MSNAIYEREVSCWYNPIIACAVEYTLTKDFSQVERMNLWIVYDVAYVVPDESVEERVEEYEKTNYCDDKKVVYSRSR